jgi:hypothetical protein
MILLACRPDEVAQAGLHVRRVDVVVRDIGELRDAVRQSRFWAGGRGGGGAEDHQHRARRTGFSFGG